MKTGNDTGSFSEILVMSLLLRYKCILKKERLLLKSAKTVHAVFFNVTEKGSYHSDSSSKRWIKSDRYIIYKYNTHFTELKPWGVITGFTYNAASRGWAYFIHFLQTCCSSRIQRSPFSHFWPEMSTVYTLARGHQKVPVWLYTMLIKTSQWACPDSGSSGSSGR